MDQQSFAHALARSFELPDVTTSGGPDARAEFSARFAAVLQRLERSRGASQGEAESLMSALGAAQVQEWELALAFLDAGRRLPSHARRVPLSVGTLRQRFNFVMSMGADCKRTR
jgi:hypothetical protein